VSVSVRFRVWVEVGGVHLIGPGGYDILKAIDETGSISGAARRLGMSYRFVWNYIDKMEKTSGMPHPVVPNHLSSFVGIPHPWGITSQFPTGPGTRALTVSSRHGAN